jgi:hypothetical protein
MRYNEPQNDSALALLFVGLLVLGGAYMLAVWHVWKWVESGYK